MLFFFGSIIQENTLRGMKTKNAIQLAQNGYEKETKKKKKKFTKYHYITLPSTHLSKLLLQLVFSSYVLSTCRLQGTQLLC